MSTRCAWIDQPLPGASYTVSPANRPGPHAWWPGPGAWVADAALGWKRQGSGVGEDVVPKRAGGQRRRRANVPGGRSQVRVDVKLSAEEAAMLKLRAAKQKVSLPRLLVESTLASGGQTYTQQRDQLAALFAFQRTLSGIATNVNQLAKWANTNSQFPEQATETTKAVYELCWRLERVIGQFDTPQLVPHAPAETPLDFTALEGSAADVDELPDDEVEPGEWGDVDDARDYTGTALEGTDWDTWNRSAPPASTESTEAPER